MNQFIALEGVDASGKTTIGRMLSREHSGAYVKTPGDGYGAIREFVDRKTSPRARLLFYLSSVVEASHHIARTLADQSVFCDRYVWSTLIPHSAYYGADLDKLVRDLQPITTTLIQPHHTVLLQVSEDEQLRRLQSGERTKPLSVSDTFCLDAPKRRRVRELYDHVADCLGWTKVDTTDRSPEAVVEEVNNRCMRREALAA